MSSLFTLGEDKYLYLKSRSDGLMKIDLEGFTLENIFCDFSEEEVSTTLTFERKGMSPCKVLPSREDRKPHSWLRFSCPDREESYVLNIQDSLLTRGDYCYNNADRISIFNLLVHVLPQTYDDVIAEILKE